LGDALQKQVKKDPSRRIDRGAKGASGGLRPPIWQAQGRQDDAGGGRAKKRPARQLCGGRWPPKPARRLCGRPWPPKLSLERRRLIATRADSEIATTHSKQRHKQILIATPNTFPPPLFCRLRTSARELPIAGHSSRHPVLSLPRALALSLLFPSSDVTSNSTPTPGRFNSNRNRAETGIAVTPTKQTTVVLSNRNKKTPPRGVTKLQPDGTRSRSLTPFADYATGFGMTT
jgi:hypothetical protein